MNAIQILRDYYQGDRQALRQHLIFFNRAGVAHLDSKACLLAYQVPAHAWDEQIINLFATGPILTGEPETWHIHLATGHLAEIRRVMETAFPKAEILTFQRKGGRLRRVSTKHLKRLTSLPYGILTTKAPDARASNEGPKRGRQRKKEKPLTGP